MLGFMFDIPVTMSIHKNVTQSCEFMLSIIHNTKIIQLYKIQK